MRAFAVAVAVAVSLGAVACAGGCAGGGAGGTLQLAWLFADGRDCMDAGANRVELRLAPPKNDADRPLATFACTLGHAPATVTTAMLPGGGTLYLDARSPEYADLYRGELVLDGAPLGKTTAATVTLYAAVAN